MGTHGPRSVAMVRVYSRDGRRAVPMNLISEGGVRQPEAEPRRVHLRGSQRVDARGVGIVSELSRVCFEQRVLSVATAET